MSSTSLSLKHSHLHLRSQSFSDNFIIFSTISIAGTGVQLIFGILHDCPLLLFSFLSVNIKCSHSIAGLDGINEEIDETEEMDEEVAVPVVPRVDADGWETVIRGTKKTGKKK